MNLEPRPYFVALLAGVIESWVPMRSRLYRTSPHTTGSHLDQVGRVKLALRKEKKSGEHANERDGPGNASEAAGRGARDRSSRGVGRALTRLRSARHELP